MKNESPNQPAETGTGPLPDLPSQPAARPGTPEGSEKTSQMITTIIAGLFVVIAGALSGVVATCVRSGEGSAAAAGGAASAVVLDSDYVPSGWMGEPGRVKCERVAADVFGSQKVVIRITYDPGPTGWAGIYWQSPDGNWGTSPGRDLSGVKKISFLVRGESGGEIVEFRAGGTKGKFPDTFVQSIGKSALSKGWERRTINLDGKDLSNVAGAFCWSAAASDNKTSPIVFYIADLAFE